MTNLPNSQQTEPASKTKIWAVRAFRFACVLLPILFVLYSTLPAIHAWWSIIDDHRKMHILAVEQGMPVSAAFRHFWNAIDFGPLGTATRVQPIFHVIWGMELHWFGLNPQLWYLTRIGCALIFIGCLSLTILRHTGAITALLTGISVAIPAFYSQVFLRLGVAESYLAAAMSLALFCASSKEQARPSLRLINATVYLVALLIFFGSKEVALAFAPAVAFIALVDYRQRGWSSPRLWAGVVGLSFATFVFVAIVLGLRGHTKDIYGQDLSLAKRLTLVLQSDFLPRSLVICMLAGILAPILCLLIGKRFKAYSTSQPVLNALGCCTLAVSIAYFGTLLFYNASIPAGSHYEYPTYLLAQSISFLGISSTLVLIFSPFPYNVGKTLSFTLTAVVLFIITVKQQPGFFQLRRNAETIQKQTAAFEQRFTVLLNQANADPRRPIEFVSHGFNDFEPVHSMIRFLRGYGAQNPIILNTAYLAKLEPQSNWEKYLQSLMIGIKPSPNGFTKVTTEDPSEQTIIIFFSRTELSERAIGNFWPM